MVAQIIQLILMLPQLIAALKQAAKLHKEAQADQFYQDSIKAFSALDKAKTDDEIKDAARMLRDLYRK